MENQSSVIPESPEAQVIENNKAVSFHYRLCEVDLQGNHRSWREESFGKQPLLYLHGFHNVVVGLEKALAGKRIGDEISITLSPEDAYGPRQPNAVQRVPIKHIQLRPDQKRPMPGMIASVQTQRGPRMVMLLKVGKFNVDVDFNHPLAGKTLYYEIEVVDIKDGTPEEIAHGHVHGPGGHHH